MTTSHTSCARIRRLSLLHFAYVTWWLSWVYIGLWAAGYFLDPDPTPRQLREAVTPAATCLALGLALASAVSLAAEKPAEVPAVFAILAAEKVAIAGFATLGFGIPLLEIALT